jgi:DNA-binding FadR family transcriptional regulator
MAATLPEHPSEPSQSTGVFRAEPPVRQRVADHVFESLARAILNGELKPNEPLATQRDLAQQIGRAHV